MQNSQASARTSSVSFVPALIPPHEERHSKIPRRVWSRRVMSGGGELCKLTVLEICTSAVSVSQWQRLGMRYHADS